MINRREKIKEMMDSFRSMRRFSAFKPLGKERLPRVTPSQWGVLMMMDGEGEHTVKDVAKALGITSSAATQLIDGLVASGYVVRKEYEQDRRKVTLVLSPKTKKQVERMRGEVAKQFLTLFEVLNDKEFGQFISLHKKVFDRHSHNT